jgi:5'-methylthioadenosine phosphorylase
LRPDDFWENTQHLTIDTSAGFVSVDIGRNGNWEGIFLQRSHGKPGVPPHLISYRSNILALKELGAQYIFATSIVGSLSTTIPAGSFLVVDQFLDFTKQRNLSVFDETGFAFVDMTDPYCPQLRTALINAARELNQMIRPMGCYVAVEGPRYETRAEIEMYRRLGGDVIGMTNVPEVVIARELGLCYATLAYVSNLGAGLNSAPVTRKENYHATLRGVPALRSLLKKTLDIFSPDDSCACRFANEDFLSAMAASPSSIDGNRDEYPESKGFMERSFILLRPESLQNALVGKILHRLEELPARLVALKLVHLSSEQVRELYNRPDVVDYLPEIIQTHLVGPSIVMVLVGDTGLCELVEAEADRIRHDFGIDRLHNCIHASDCPANAEREIRIFFRPEELIVTRTTSGT